MERKPWKIFPRPLLECILKNYAQPHRVPQPLILHGPRGVGKTALIFHRLLEDWNSPPHLTGYVDFAPPHSSWSSPTQSLHSLRDLLEKCLESMVHAALRFGAVGNQQIFSTMNKWHGLDGALLHILSTHRLHQPDRSKSNRRISTSALWSRAVFALASKSESNEVDNVVGLGHTGKMVTVEEASYLREALVSLRLAKEVIDIHQKWRASAVMHLNEVGGFSRSLANSATDWPCLLLELLSSAAEIGFFQPKLIVNNIDVLWKALVADDSVISASMYHDSLLWRLIALGVNERCLPVILVTSDSYYSYRAFMDFGYPDIFISRETFGWTPEEAKMHLVPEFFSDTEWPVIAEVLGPNSQHLYDLYALKGSDYYHRIMEQDGQNIFEDIVDSYLAYLQNWNTCER